MAMATAINVVVMSTLGVKSTAMCINITDHYNTQNESR